MERFTKNRSTHPIRPVVRRAVSGELAFVPSARELVRSMSRDGCRDFLGNIDPGKNVAALYKCVEKQDGRKPHSFGNARAGLMIDGTESAR